MSFAIPVERRRGKIGEVVLGATVEQGGTRSSTVTIGGATNMPFHWFEGDYPHRPALAMEVYDLPPARYPQVLKDAFGDLLADPAAMAKRCVEEYGADLINVRLEGTHPEKEDNSAEGASKVVGAVLKAVGVPVMVTGTAHFEKTNEVLRRIAEDHAGERLLLGWVEPDNYRTAAAACLAYGHLLMAQSPIDFNIAKQLNILLHNMDFPTDRIVIDAMTGALGYGIEYTYSVMERIRIAALDGDAMLQMPMVVTGAWECQRTKEANASAEDQPGWGQIKERFVGWEVGTCGSLLLAGGDLLVVAHPESAKKVRALIDDLMKKGE
ncbi:MAG: acetyl-CoA decarbonylase/synthase complex subunit delta [Proteobacteria bacterium]|nr:acetyl-CoA decarbonylase/synthase complex subunit delta [Pseudomonadota bacterium]